MFDVGFLELVIIGLVALIVVGPERLPRLARTAGLWIGRGRRMLSSVKAEIDRELKAEELRRILEEQARSNPSETILEAAEDDSAGPRPGDKTAGAKQDQRTE
jgi:sec-independent protein translocase protein TatB